MAEARSDQGGVGGEEGGAGAESEAGEAVGGGGGGVAAAEGVPAHAVKSPLGAREVW